MALHKMVNGVKVDCTPQEEAEILAEWEKNRLENEKKRLEREAERAKYEAALDKLLSNLTEEEQLILKKKFVR